MSIKRIGALLLLLLLCLTLSGCRARITNGETAVPPSARTEASLNSGAEEQGEPENQEETEQADMPGGTSRENPEAARKEFDERAPAEILTGAERTVHGEGEGGGASAERVDADSAVSMLNSEAEKTATQRVAEEEAERMAVSEDAEEADSAMTYFTVLLQDRMGSLFECKRLNVYWETAEDHVTVFKSSPEHQLILDAGAYDVSARLLEENLRVDDGWICRKNPDLIVKVVDSGALGAGAASAAAARAVCDSLLAREGWSAIEAVRSGRVLLISAELLERPYLQTAAMLYIAKVSHPELMADVDTGKALEMLAEEATGALPTGVYAYCMSGGV